MEGIEAKLIEYTFEEEDFDICQGYRTRQYKNNAIMVNYNSREVMAVVPWGKETHFFRIMEKKPDGSIVYRSSGRVPLPKNTAEIKIIKKITITHQLAWAIVEAEMMIETITEAEAKIRKAANKVNDLLKEHV